MNTSDNERAALEAARQEAKGQQSDDHEGPPPWFLWVVALLIVGGAVAFLVKSDPCLKQRIQWWLNTEGEMRSCAFDAQCSVNDGEMQHVAKGEGYMWFDAKSKPRCNPAVTF